MKHLTTLTAIKYGLLFLGLAALGHSSYALAEINQLNDSNLLNGDVLLSRRGLYQTLGAINANIRGIVFSLDEYSTGGGIYYAGIYGQPEGCGGFSMATTSPHLIDHKGKYLFLLNETYPIIDNDITGCNITIFLAPSPPEIPSINVLVYGSYNNPYVDGSCIASCDPDLIPQADVYFRLLDEQGVLNYLDSGGLSSILTLSSPLNNEVVSSTSVNFIIQYQNWNNYNKIGIRITREDQYFNTFYIEDNALAGQNSFSTTTILAGNASYFYQAYLKNASSTFYSTDIKNFYTIATPYPNATTSPIDTSIECDNVFCVVLVKLFKPSIGSLTRFSNLKTIIENKPPFGYFTSIKNALNNFNASATPAFALTQVSSLMTNVLNPLRIGLTWVLWVMFGIWIIKRIARFDF
jgi:hypothetical protein